jgi:hypothetical protein
MRDERTNVAWEHEEVIVSQAAILLGVNEGLDVNAIALGVLVLEHLEGFGVVQSIGRGVGHGVAVGDRHSGGKYASQGTEKSVRGLTERNRPQLLCNFGRGKFQFSQEEKEHEKFEAKLLCWELRTDQSRPRFRSRTWWFFVPCTHRIVEDVRP